MSDRDLQIQLLRHLSMEKRAWYGSTSGGQAPQLPQVGAPEPSEAPAIGRPAMGGTLAAQAANKAAESATLIQQNLAEKMQPLKQPSEPIRPASQPTARQRNDRMARQVTQPDAGKTSVAHVVSPHDLDKTAQGRFWNAATTWAEDAQKALGSPMQALSEGLYEIPGIGRSLRKADAWMGRNVGRDPGTFLSQEVVQPAAQAVAKGLTTKIPGVNASVAEGMEALGQGLTGMPVTTPVGFGLRAGAAELQAAGRAARALPGVVRAGARTAGQAALQYGDDLAAKVFPAVGPELAYAGAGGRAAAATESRLASSASRGPGNLLMSKAEPFEVWRSPPARAPAATPTSSPRVPPAQSTPSVQAASGAVDEFEPFGSRFRQTPQTSTAPVVEAAETAAQSVPKPSLMARLTGGSGSRLPQPREVTTTGKPVGGGAAAAKAKAPTRQIGEDVATLRQQVRQTDPTGRGAGALANDPAAMQQLLRNMNYGGMGPVQRFFRQTSAALARPFNQIPMPGLGSQGAGLSTEGGVGPWISRQFYNAARSIPVVGPQRYGGAGLLRSSETGRITPLNVGLTAGGLGYAGYKGTKAAIPYARAARQIAAGAPAGQTIREVNDPQAVMARTAQEQLGRMSPEQIRAYMASLPGAVTSTEQ